MMSLGGKEMKRTFVQAAAGLVVLIGCTAGSLEVMQKDAILRHGFAEDDLKHLVYRTNGEVIFFRDSESFESSRAAASDAAFRKSAPRDAFTERVALTNNTTGFFDHRTDSLIYIRFKGGEWIFPFDLDSGQLVATTIVVDGKKYAYEEGEATLMFYAKRADGKSDR